LRQISHWSQLSDCLPQLTYFEVAMHGWHMAKEHHLQIQQASHYNQQAMPLAHTVIQTLDHVARQD